MTHFASIFLQPFSQAFAFSFSEHFNRFLCPFLGSLPHLTFVSRPQICDTGHLFHTERDDMGTTYTRCHTWNISSKLFESRVALGNVVITGIGAAGCFNVII